jgi:hypothetical protein
MIAALFRRRSPAPIANAQPARAVIDLSDLTRSARKAILSERLARTTDALRRARPAPLTPHDILFADIRAARATKGA